jgi:hypothetical protein
MTKRLSEALPEAVPDLPRGLERPAAVKVVIVRSTKLIPKTTEVLHARPNQK